MRITKLILKWIFGIAFVFAGLNHFINPAFYMRIMPPNLPWHEFLVQLSGICEIFLGLLLLIPKFSRIAAWGLVALLIAVFPANIHMAMNTELFPDINSTFIWLRLPIQILLIYCAVWFTIPVSQARIET